MEPIQIIAGLAIAMGAAYIVMAALAVRRLRTRRADDTAEAQAVVNLNDMMLVEGEMTADRMHKMAAICASIGRRVFNEELDFTTESVGRLERMILRGWSCEDQSAAAEAHPQTPISLGAYLGEVLARNTRGRWVSNLNDEDPAAVFFVAPDDQTVSVSPFLMIRQKFDGMYAFDLQMAYTALEQKLKELGVR